MTSRDEIYEKIFLTLTANIASNYRLSDIDASLIKSTTDKLVAAFFNEDTTEPKKDLTKLDVKNRSDHPFYREGYQNAVWHIYYLLSSRLENKQLGILSAKAYIQELIAEFKLEAAAAYERLTAIRKSYGDKEQI